MGSLISDVLIHDVVDGLVASADGDVHVSLGVFSNLSGAPFFRRLARSSFSWQGSQCVSEGGGSPQLVPKLGSLFLGERVGMGSLISEEAVVDLDV